MIWMLTENPQPMVRSDTRDDESEGREGGREYTENRAPDERDQETSQLSAAATPLKPLHSWYSSSRWLGYLMMLG